MRRGYRNATITIALAALLILVLSPLLLDRLERAMISTGPNGPETPATVGLTYERLKIPSGRRLLDAYTLFQERFAATGRVCVLGFSMGNAVLLDAYTEFHPAPACMIVGGAFSSARDGAAHAWHIPGWMARALPDQWNNVAAISHSHSPLLVVHSDADRANPIWMGERIYNAAPEPKQIVILHGLRHNAAYTGPTEQWWAPVIKFIEDGETVR